MAHFTRAETFGTWVNGYHPTTADMQSFDARMRGAIDGDNGGSWAPTTFMDIGGIGAVPGVQLTGPLVIAFGGSLTSNTGTPFNLLDGDYPQYAVGHTGRSRTVMHSPCLAKGFPARLWRARSQDAGLQAYAPCWTTIANGQTTPQPGLAFVPIRAHDGATLSSITVYFRVGQPHANVPPIMPKIRMCRMDSSGHITSMTSQAAGADVNGFVAIPSPTTGGAWYALGATQSITITCDQNNVIDLSQYDYQVQIVEESGFTTAFDSTGVQTQGQGLVVDRLGSPSWQNQLLSAAATPTLWTAPIWQATHSFAAGAVVFPTTADPTAGLYFINNGGSASSGSAEPAWPKTLGAKVVDGGITWTALGTTQKLGTIWQAIATNYTNIVDGHFQ